MAVLAWSLSPVSKEGLGVYRVPVTSVVLVCILGLLVPPALGDLTATVTLSDGYGDSGGAGHGGEFLAAPSGFSFTPASLGEVADKFEVFCVEINEYHRFGNTYYVDFNPYAVAGGAGGGSPDFLSPETAYLYNQFITGNLGPYDYADSGFGRTESANALQNVIWHFEDELADYTTGLTANEIILADQFYALGLNSGWTDIGLVQVMNLYANPDKTLFKQDQLVMAVPAPGAAILAIFGAGIAGLGWRRFH